MFFLDDKAQQAERERVAKLDDLAQDAQTELIRSSRAPGGVKTGNLLPVNQALMGQRTDSISHLHNPNEYAIQQLANMFADASAYTSHWKADAGEARLFALMLQHVVAAATPTLYTRNQARSLFPIDTSIPAGAETVLKQRVIDEDDLDEGGQISPNGDDIQMVEISGTSEIHRLVSFARGIYWSLDELESAAFAGVGLRNEKTAALNRSVETLFNLMAYVGYATAGTTGAYNDANIVLTAPTTGTWAAPATADQILADIHDLIEAVELASGYNARPTRLIMPSSLVTFLSVRRANTDLNVRTMVGQDFPGLQIMECDRANTYDVAGTGPRIMAFTPDPAMLNIAVARPFTLEPPEKHGLRFRLFGRMKLGGCICSMPLTAGHMDGC